MALKKNKKQDKSAGLNISVKTEGAEYTFLLDGRLDTLTSPDLDSKVKELKTELFNLRFQLATGQLQNTVQITNVKRDIARAKTILRQKQQA